MNWTRNIFLVALCHIFIVQSFLAIAGEPMETDMPLRRYAEAGNPASQITLGVYYLEGKQGLPVDPAEGVKWLGLAVEQGHPFAQAMLAALYEKGEAVPRELAKTVRWARRAVAQHAGMGQRVLAKYETPGGLGDPLAGNWVGSARRPNGDKIALRVELRYDDGAYSGRLSLDSRLIGVAECAYVERRRKRHAMLKTETSDSASSVSVALEGNVGYDRWDGILELTVAGADGSGEMPFRLARGEIALAEMTTGEGEHLRNLRKKIAAGDAMAMHDLGDGYVNGAFGLQADVAEGIRLRERSAEGGYVFAMYKLGFDYTHNVEVLGIPGATSLTVDELREKGFAWLERAAALGEQPAILTLERLRKKAVKTDAGTTDRTEEERR